MTELYHVTPDCLCNGKVCRDCGTLKCIAAFPSHQATCKPCTSVRRKIYNQLHSEHNKAWSKQWRETHPDYAKTKSKARKQEKKEENRAYYRRENVKERKLAWRSHPEVKAHLAAYKQEYNSSPEGRVRARGYQHKRRAQKNATSGTHTVEQVREQYDRQKGKCYYCKSKVKWGKHHEEHVIPLSRGGSNDISNIVISCAYCNLSKNDKLPHEWIKGGKLL